MVNLKSPTELQLEFERINKDFSGYHGDMTFHLDAYKNSIYWPQRPNAPKRKQTGVNFLQVFADKLWFYLQPFPKISVPPCAEDKEQAGKREKLILSTHDRNSSEVTWNKQAFDAVHFSCIITHIDYDFRSNFVDVKRVDPRRAIWQKADGNGNEVETFWFVEPMTKTAIKAKYGVTPTGSSMSAALLTDYEVQPMDGEDYYAVITRVGRDTQVKWVGDKLLQQPHQHLMGAHPVVLSFPLPIASYDMRGDFYLRRLLSLQADFNELWQQRMSVVRKLGNPTVWGRNIRQKQFGPVKDAMNLDGGFVGLADGGELGILTIPETSMIDVALMDTFARMKDVAGFPTATFGEVAGANTSGDALGMYFQPTTRMIDNFNTAIRNHWVKVNALILRAYDTYLPMGQTVKLHGTVPKGTTTVNQQGMAVPVSGGYYDEVDKSVIMGNYHNVVTMNPAAPKDEQAYKKLVLDAATQGIISKTTFYDEWGFLSPEDQMNLLMTENQNPAAAPDAILKQAQAYQANTAANVAMQPQPQPQVTQGA